MPSRLPKHLHDAAVAAGLACDLLAGVDDAAYLANVLLRSAVERQLVILGEACRRALEEAPDLLRAGDQVVQVQQPVTRHESSPVRLECRHAA